LAKLPRITAQEAEKLLLKEGFKMMRSKGSHRIYIREGRRIVVPFHPGKILHPKVVKQVLRNMGNE
jgi:predicted RNA binding protein YcfA (HicA-like mRNA interferase family)